MLDVGLGRVQNLTECTYSPGQPPPRSTRLHRFSERGVAELQCRIALIETAFDLDDLTRDRLTQRDIARYYRHSALGYRWVHSRAGAMHMAINPDGVFTEHGYYEQAHAVERWLTPDTGSTLELAIGNGFNISYLAERHQHTQFTGIDLVPENVRRARRRAARLENATVQVADFHALPFADRSFDLAFVIEALCHATDMPRALAEIRRVLRPAGKLIVIDGWRTARYSVLPEPVRTAAKLIERAMSIAEPWTLPQWIDQAKRTGLQSIEEIDYCTSVMPNLKRLERIAATYFRHPLLACISRRLLPQALLRNAIAGYLMPLTVATGAHTYRLVALQRS